MVRNVIERINIITKQHFPTYAQIFNDGSKNQLGVGAAIWIPSTSFSLSLTLPTFTSVFHAEKVAILQALRYIKNNYTNGSFLIISDSRSALQSFSSPPTHTNPSLASPIISLIKSLATFFIQFLWIPSHSGIIHSEKVNQLAKSAPCSAIISTTLPNSELSTLIKRSTLDVWSHPYIKSFSNVKSHYLTIQPQL